MEGNRCFFIGHREADEEILPLLLENVLHFITEYNVRYFYVGGYGNFDRLASRAVIAAKQSYSDIRLYLLLPYHPTERPINTPKGYDGTFYPEGMESVPRRFAITYANRYMIDFCDCLIAFAWHPASNALKLLKCAQRKEKAGKIHIVNLGERNNLF